MPLSKSKTIEETHCSNRARSILARLDFGAILVFSVLASERGGVVVVAVWGGGD